MHPQSHSLTIGGTVLKGFDNLDTYIGAFEIAPYRKYIYIIYHTTNQGLMTLILLRSIFAQFQQPLLKGLVYWYIYEEVVKNDKNGSGKNDSQNDIG